LVDWLVVGWLVSWLASWWLIWFSFISFVGCLGYASTSGPVIKDEKVESKWHAN